MVIKKVLLVDDDPISLQVLRNYLHNQYEFETAEDGLQAWQLLQAKPDDFAVVIADRIMPKLHALQLLEKMQVHEKLRNLPMILLTGEAEKEEQIAAIKVGIFDFLYKPVDAKLLLSVLQRAFNKINL